MQFAIRVASCERATLGPHFPTKAAWVLRFVLGSRHNGTPEHEQLEHHFLSSLLSHPQQSSSQARQWLSTVSRSPRHPNPTLLTHRADVDVPKTIPRPVDDGLASHLFGSSVPADVVLTSTSDASINLAALPGLTILFVYPRTAAPGEAVTEEWNNTPGARGCTAEVCHYRDDWSALAALGANAVFGLSVQSTSYQKEVKERLGLPFDLLSDEKLELVKALRLPVLEWQGAPLAKRITLVLADGKVERVWYPVFPPEASSTEVAAWLREKK